MSGVEPRAQRFVAMAPAVAVLLATAALLAAFPFRIDHDSALYLDCARQLLRGARPYVDFVELNPPFVIYLHAIPVALATLLHLPLIPTFSFLVLALAAWSVFTIGGRLLRSPAGAAVAAPCAAAWALVTAFLVFSDDFGQREHLIALLFLPYLVSRSLRFGDEGEPPESRARLVALGIAAGCSVCLKPQFLALAVALEVFWGLAARDRRRGIDPGMLAAGGTVALHALHFFLLPVAIRHEFFTRWLPLIAARYHVYDAPLRTLFDVRVVGAAILGLGAWLTASRWPRHHGILIGALGLFVTGSVGLYFAQHKGWSYHRIPIAAGCAMLATVLVARLGAASAHVARSAPTRRRSRAVAALAGIAALAAVQPLPGRFNGARWLGGEARAEAVAAAAAPGAGEPVESVIERYTRPGEPVMLLGTSVPLSYPRMLRMDRAPGSRFPWCFPIAMVAGVSAASPIPGPRDAWLAGEERRLLADLDADLHTRRPPLVLLSTRLGPPGCPPGFRVSDYLERSGFVARLAPAYVRVEDTDEFSVYVLRDRVAR